MGAFHGKNITERVPFTWTARPVQNFRKTRTEARADLGAVWKLKVSCATCSDGESDSGWAEEGRGWAAAETE
jgi:hypothetical protein